MEQISNILEHVCTIFTVITPGCHCFLEVFLNAKGLQQDSLNAYLNSKREVIINAKTETSKSSEIIFREVQNKLTVPQNVMVEKSEIILLRNGLLLIKIPYMSMDLDKQQNEKQINESDRTVLQEYKTLLSSEHDSKINNNEETQTHHLDRHQTIREGNKLILMIPLDQNYKEENIKVTVVQRSVCITVTYLDYCSTTRLNSNNSDSKHIVQRTYYKEYEASDCIPDPESINFHVDNNCLIVNLNITKKSQLPQMS
ncbi:hypothetical protein EWB00_005804 [Schistosoma japonicum]|uniref:SJCHGC04198 protein n=1 Tax=Schistosoma japonicum TaxID=6182 RepID=Q5DCX1_SCHJA|nr:SJCHGC04198 protein [Schistosoma japonicum]TNN10048.1 hypothetical protein EWB00_005804 [Schistosoma japonicum]